jgi:diguanylate cyclase (GGDEF)-like protein
MAWSLARAAADAEAAGCAREGQSIRPNGPSYLKQRPLRVDRLDVELLTCRDDAERGRLLDLSRRLRPMELRGSVLFLIAALVGAPVAGPLAALPAMPGLGLFWVLQARLERFRRPEHALLACLVVLQVGLAVSLSIGGGPRIFSLGLLIVPVLLASVVFPVRTAVVVVVFSAQLMLAVGLIADLQAVRQMPFALLYPLAVMIGASGVAMVVAGLDLKTRGAAIVDPLTGLPNRVALRARVAELEHQAGINGRPVALIIGDPDRFKAINDTRGHATGDAVLREVAARMRTALHGGGGAYRLGGEEFAVLVGDADVAVGAEIAERMRRAISARAIEGVGVAISFGVAASKPGEPFDFSRLFGEADRALYEAKHAGGNRVRMWPLAGAQVPALAAAAEADLAAGGPLSPPATGSAHADCVPAAQAGEARGQEDGGVKPAHDGASGADAADRWARWNAREHAATGNWLVSDDLQRRQLLELNRRLREKAKPIFAIGFAVGGASAVQYGWQILLPPAVMAVIYILLEHHIERFSHPEYMLGAGWMGLQTSFLLSGLLANAPMVFAAPLLLLLLVGSSAVFPPRGVVVGVVTTSVIILVVGFAEDAQLVLSAPGVLLFDLATVAVVGMLGATIGRSTIDYRDFAIVDQLTGLFNRGALVARAAELAHRNPQGGSPVAVIVADIDRFKAINDSYGHATGDAVLQQIGERVRANLRAFESAYRIGGEELVVLLDEVDWKHAEHVALRLREAVRSTPLAGVDVTVSLGIAATAPGEAFDYDTVFRRADAALYEAKRSGGDQVFAARGLVTAGRPGRGVQAQFETRAIGLPSVQAGA